MPASAEIWLSILLAALGVGAVSGGVYWSAGAFRIIRSLRDMGIDGLFSDHVDRMVEAVAAVEG